MSYVSQCQLCKMPYKNGLSVLPLIKIQKIESASFILGTRKLRAELPSNKVIPYSQCCYLMPYEESVVLLYILTFIVPFQVF